MPQTKQNHSSLRIFGTSGIVTIAGLISVLCGFGASALAVTAVLVVIEVVFSFDNAIVNAKVLGKLSPKWQSAFLTIGMVVAIFGMRLLFPILIVAFAAHLSLSEVWNMALHHPHEYAAKLTAAHPLIAAFGGAFLLLLSLEFFLNGQHDVVWWGGVEKQLKRFRSIWLPTAIAVCTVLLIGFINKEHGGEIMRAGLLGVATYVVVQVGINLLSINQPKGKQLVGWAAFTTFMYLQVLDASFSFDGVIGAFAITDVVVLIAIGLGIGALWVRSLTVFMVRHGTLDQYIYLEHGAYYTIAVLAAALFISLFVDVSDVVTGMIGLGIIGSAVASSVQAKRSFAMHRISDHF